MKMKTNSCFPKLIIGFLVMLGIVCSLNGLGYSQEAGDRWLFVTISTDETKFYQDSTYKVLSNNNRVIWEKHYRKDGTNALVLMEYNCKQAKKRTLEEVEYDVRGKVESSNTISYSQWSTPIPDSVGEALFENVCSVKSSATSEPATNYKRERPVTPPPARDDIGVDYAIVTAVRANLREGLGTDTEVVLTIPRDDMVVLLNNGIYSGWHNVIHVKSNSEGFIHESTISIYRTQNRTPLLTIQGHDSGTYKNPSVEVKNDSSKTMTLKMNQTLYVFSPQESKSIILAPGKYSFHASAPNVIPKFGEQDFQLGYNYTWRFFIVTIRR